MEAPPAVLLSKKSKFPELAMVAVPAVAFPRNATIRPLLLVIVAEPAVLVSKKARLPAFVMLTFSALLALRKFVNPTFKMSVTALMSALTISNVP